MSWLHKIVPSGILRRSPKGGERHSAKKDVITCDNCNHISLRDLCERMHYTCPQCRHHLPIRARKRLEIFLDKGDWEEIGNDILAKDRIKFKDIKSYQDRLKQSTQKTGEVEALITIRGELMRLPLVAAAFEFSFMGGSMGAAVGRRFLQAVDTCIEHQVPLVCFCASGGARMQEAMFSLIQMASTAAALGRLREARLPYVSVLTHPTTGGVAASLASLGDINIGEPNALIGFTGPRVIEQTIGAKLPQGFQRSEFLLEHGTLDMIVDRREMRQRIHRLLKILMHGRSRDRERVKNLPNPVASLPAP